MRTHVRSLVVCFVVFAIGCCLLPGSAMAAGYNYIGKFGGPGTGDRQFDGIGGIAVDGSGNIYVADKGNKRIEKFGADGSFTQWGTQGETPQSGIAVDRSGSNVYVTDYAGGKILQFTSAGVFVRQVDTKVPSDILDSNPVSIAVDSMGQMWVADSGDMRLKRFDSSGGFLGFVATPGSAPGQLQAPVGVAVDLSDNAYVVDYARYDVQKFSSGGSYIGGHSTICAGDANLLYPELVCVDRLGNIFVGDDFTGQLITDESVKEFNSAYVLQTRIGAYAGGSGLDGTFSDIAGIAVGPTGTVYLADTALNRVIEFAPPAGSQAAAAYSSSTTTKLVAPSSVKVKKALKLSGTVSPAPSGGTVKITKTRKVGKKWKSMGSATVNVVNGRFSYSFKPTAKGSWQFVAVCGSSKSATKTVKVK